MININEKYQTERKKKVWSLYKKNVTLLMYKQNIFERWKEGDRYSISLIRERLKYGFSESIGEHLVKCWIDEFEVSKGVDAHAAV